MNFESPKNLGAKKENEPDDLQQARDRVEEIKQEWNKLFVARDKGTIGDADFNTQRQALVDENRELEEKLGM